ncbi:MAG: 4-(cytidine 5'-diphospho)-2-C-methyl-D-erythritol kinase, partial [Pirellulales bacterium]
TAGSPFGLDTAGSPLGLDTAGSPFGLDTAGSPFGLDTAGSPFGLDTAGSPLGLDVELVKRVPAGAGLGGGSSDAAAVLRAAAAVWGIDWPAERMMELAARIGSDVPWFFAGGPAIVAGRGEQVGKPLPLPALVAVIARPVGGLSTPAVYKQCRPTAAHRGGAQRLAAALAAGRWRAAVREQHNDLERPAMELSADVGRLLAAMAWAGCVRPMLTGSGSACFALVRGMVEGRRIAARLGAAGWPGVWLVRTESTKVST